MARSISCGHFFCKGIQLYKPGAVNGFGERASTKRVDDNISLLEAEGMEFGLSFVEGVDTVCRYYPNGYRSCFFYKCLSSAIPPISARTSTAPTILMLKKMPNTKLSYEYYA